MKRHAWDIPAALWALLLGSATVAQANESMVPAKRQAPILLKIMSFDYTLPQRVKDVVHIGVTFNDKEAVSSAVAKDMHAAFIQFKSLTVQNLPIQVSLLPYSGPGSLKSGIEGQGINTLYICPGLDRQLEEILKVTQARKLSVLTGLKRYVQQGVVIGVLMEGAKPKIAINLAAMKAHGQRLSANVLKMATIIQ